MFVFQLKEREDSILYAEVLNIRIQVPVLGLAAGYILQVFGIIATGLGLFITEAAGYGVVGDHLLLTFGMGLIALGDLIRGKGIE